MSNDEDLPVLTDLIERGDEIKMSDLGFVENNAIADDPFAHLAEIPELESEIDPFLKASLEQSIRRILDEHMELALQEIKIVIERELSKPR